MNYGNEFSFRGLQFREYTHGIGLQVYCTTRHKWYDTDILNRKALEQDYLNFPDIQTWHDRQPQGSIKFISQERDRSTQAEVIGKRKELLRKKRSPEGAEIERKHYATHLRQRHLYHT